jgi:hypothetical protein
MINGTEVNLELTLHAESATGTLVLDGDGRAAWLPRAEINYDGAANLGDTITITMPVWLATAKGLI